MHKSASIGRAKIRVRNQNNELKIRKIRIGKRPSEKILRALRKSGGYQPSLAGEIAVAERLKGVVRKTMPGAERYAARTVLAFEKLPEKLLPGKVRRLHISDVSSIPKGYLVEITFEPEDLNPKHMKERKYKGGMINYGVRSNSYSVIAQVSNIWRAEIGSGNTIHAEVLYDFDLADGQFARRKYPDPTFFYTSERAFPRIKSVNLVEIEI